MYGFEKQYILEDVIKKLDDEKIFRYYFPDYELNVYFSNPFRVDNNPSAVVVKRNGRLYFKDFPSGIKAIDSIGLVSYVESISFSEALRWISENNFLEKKEIQREKVFSEDNNYCTIEITPRKWTKYDQLYWKSYGISSSNLKEDGIIPISDYSVYTQDRTISRSPLYKNVPYAIPFGNEIYKLCFPINNRGRRFITNAGYNVIGGTKSLPFTGENLVITKSYKDWRVLKNLGLDCIYFQSESQFPELSELEPILRMFDNIFIWFDNDPPGIVGADKLSKHISNYNPQILNMKHFEKDPSDVIKAGDIQFLKNFIKQKINEKS